MWIVRYMRWIMLVSGVLTATMVQAAITPDSALQSNFGETVSGPLAHLVVRNWGALIALVGGMLIYGAFNQPPTNPTIHAMSKTRENVSTPGRATKSGTRSSNLFRCG
jgi:cbb3-type cytochrome oxidase subunit 1